MRTTGFRSLADQLRSWPDERVARLLTLRGDLATPPPLDSGQLASRAATRSSLLRALDQLGRLDLCVLDALVVAGQTTREELGELVWTTPQALDRSLDLLVDLALVWESSTGLRALTGVPELLVGGPGSSGLRPRSEQPAAAATIQAHLADVSPEARALLEHVVDQGGEAVTGNARRTVGLAEAATPVEELIARGLLVGRGGESLLVPGEVGIAVRGGHTTSAPLPAPPELVTSERGAAVVDRVAAGAAGDLVRHVELLLDRWGARPPAALRTGGLGVRDLKNIAVALQTDEPTAAFWIELAASAGLLATGIGPDDDTCWMPSEAFDEWTARNTEQRWLDLVIAWLASPRLTWLIGVRDSAGKAWNALAPELAGPHLVETRAMTLQALATLGDGEVLATGTGLPSLVELVGWQRPRRPRTRADEIASVVRDAELVGLTGLGGPASYARLLIDGDTTAAVAALAALLPAPVDHVLLQADLTAVAPGPLLPELARDLHLIADVESHGGATVFRFTPASVRRGLDAGWSAAELHAFVAASSRTPVPQPLSYLIDDLARTFGTLRVGHAEAFIRSDDESALAELLGHPQAASLGLRRIAPTVLISSVPIDLLLPRLRELGAAPVVEAPDGTVHVARPEALRSRTPRRHRTSGADAAREAARVNAVVATIRGGDRHAVDNPAKREVSAAGTIALLRESIESRTAVVIEYVDNRGTRAEQLIQPLAIESGQLIAGDPQTEDERSFAVHRIASVRAAPPSAQLPASRSS